MKWVALTLLLLNAALLVMQLTNVDEPARQVERFPFGGPQLMLLSEKNRQDAAEQVQKKAQQAEAKAETAAEAGPVTPVQTAIAEVEKPAAVVEAPKPVAKPAPPAPVTKAVVEAPKKEAPVVARPEPAPQPAATPKSNALACYSVGPFLLLSDIKGISPLFNRAGIGTQQRADNERKQVGYWVYIPPLESEQVQGALRKLKESGIADALIISEGSRANAVSVGVYNSEELGLDRQKAVARLGFDARMEPLFRTQPQYWLDLELMQETRLPDKLWREVTAGYPDIQQLRRKCE